jgi:hypothetical protein
MNVNLSNIFCSTFINNNVGIMLDGHALKVRRPKDYIPAPAIDMTGGKPSLPAGAIVATNVPDSPYKVSSLKNNKNINRKWSEHVNKTP